MVDNGLMALEISNEFMGEGVQTLKLNVFEIFSSSVFSGVPSKAFITCQANSSAMHFDRNTHLAIYKKSIVTGNSTTMAITSKSRRFRFHPFFSPVRFSAQALSDSVKAGTSASGSLARAQARTGRKGWGFYVTKMARSRCVITFT